MGSKKGVKTPFGAAASAAAAATSSSGDESNHDDNNGDADDDNCSEDAPVVDSNDYQRSNRSTPSTLSSSLPLSSPSAKKQRLAVDKDAVVEQEQQDDAADGTMEESSSSSRSSSDDEDLFAVNEGDEGSDDDDGNVNPTKSETTPAGPSNGSSARSGNRASVDPELLRHAKKRLSKFAARLFDPNRPKGLVEAPQIIPLNDEFLVAFGKREQAFDKARGVHQEFDHGIDSDDEDGGTSTETKKRKRSSDGPEGLGPPITAKDTKPTHRFKVKISNLAYRTTEDTLTKACLRFGTLAEVNLLLDQDMISASNNNQSIHNSGLAFVSFDTEDGAQACIDGLTTLDGRALRVAMAVGRPKNVGGGAGPASAPNRASLLNVALERDISTVCFRCGKVGHRESDCPNPAKPKPCPLCGLTDHEQRGCPNNRICFNCGCPGHVSRDCQYSRGSLPRRMVCGTCLQPGHHRMQCRVRSRYDLPPQILSDAVCMVCGKLGDGFLCCKDLKWFFGLKGLSCFNCGMQGHSGYDCQGPRLYQCMQDPDVTNQEIDRAEANSIAEELEKQRQENQRAREQHNRGRNVREGGGDGNRSQSVPRQRGGQQQGSRSQSAGERGGGSYRRSGNEGGRGGRGNSSGDGGGRRRDRRGY